MENYIFNISNDCDKLKNIYLFGECYFQDMELESSNIDNFIFHNMSIGNGSSYSFLNLLKTKSINEKGVFFVGGTIHDRHGWHNGKTLQQIVNWFNTLFYDSILVFCLVGPKNTQNHEHLNLNKYHEDKIEVCNHKNIFYLDLRFDNESSTDGVHMTKKQKKLMSTQILEYLHQNNFKSSSYSISIKKDLIELNVQNSNIHKCYLLHGHNKQSFSIFNNNSLMKKYSVLGDKNFGKEGFHPSLDRPILTKIIHPGKITFSESIYIDSIIVEGDVKYD